ncbi:MAG: beta-ketoacyl-[acyl-carrier-protein] synthase family protein, partial [Myxococcales bacterium]|nr:beta-ketoacyl-[acyl-carrier-protein] synthase family protein [Myxococcales bacterium]
MERVAITGMGIVSSLGISTDEFYRRVMAGEIGVRPAPWASEFEGRKMWWSAAEQFDPADWIDPKVQAGSDITVQFALAATRQAVDDAAVEFDPERTAVVHGTSIGGGRAMMLAQHQLEQAGPLAIDPKMPIQIMPNMAAAQTAIAYDLHGPSMTVTTACASSADALGLAARYIERGEADVAIAGATEGALSLPGGKADERFVPALFYGYNVYGMESFSDDPKRAMIPFDVERSGIVMGEGSGVFVLERETHARARGAAIHGYLTGYASLADASHPSSPEPSGRWEARVMEKALADAGIAPQQVDALVAHATGTPKGDTAEIQAINRVHTAGREKPLPVSSIKGHVGHSGAASGAMAVIAALRGMRDNRFFHTAGTRRVDPACEFDVVIEKPRELAVHTLQVNSFGFGGQNASLILT